MFKNIINNEKGASIIELLVYISLVVVVMMVFTDGIVRTVRQEAALVAAQEVKQNERQVIGIISQAVKTADEILSVTPNELPLVEKDGSMVRYYYDAADQAVYYDNGIETVMISGDDVNVTSAVFSREGDIVNIGLTLEYKNPGHYPESVHELSTQTRVVPRQAIY